ncbi:MAG: hypothetical protein ABIJ56_00265 [Pseudomonadota bacterium]
MSGNKLRIPFNVGDEAIFHLETADEPWGIHFEMRFDGRLDWQRLYAGLLRAIELHPMLRARQAAFQPSDHTYYWKIQESPGVAALLVADCADDADLAALRNNLLDTIIPTTRPPLLKAALARCPDGDRLLFIFSHVAGDGIGSLRVLRSVAAAYAGRQDPVPRLDLAGVRDLPKQLAAGTAGELIPRICELLAYGANALSSPAARVAEDGAREKPGYGCCLLRLDAEETASLKPRRYGPSTVNDLLLAALHKTIGTWNGRHDTPCERIGVMMPLNMRPPGRLYEGFGNMSLFISVSTNERDREDDGRLMVRIREQTERFKQGGGTAFIEVMAKSSLLPVGIKQTMPMLLPLTRDRFVETSNLSNLGRLKETLSFGPDAGGEPRSLWFSPPCKMPIGISFGIVTLQGCMHVAMRHRHAVFGAAAAARFMDLYRESLYEIG